MVGLKWTARMFLCLALAGSVGGCASDLVAHADSLATSAKLQRVMVPTDRFLLTSYMRITDDTQPFNIYIEGDGVAWITKKQKSTNPTPAKAIGLALATRDPAENVIYIARPCQFTPLERDARCESAYWTSRRFSEDVVASIDQAITALAGQGHQVNLIGYSGGGAIAVLLAARRTDVVSLRTVAGNLDHEAFTRFHGVTPLKESLNPIDQARKLAYLPQIHFASQKDKIVPFEIAENFLAASEPTVCVTIRLVNDAAHEDGWVEQWPSLLTDIPVCE